MELPSHELPLVAPTAHPGASFKLPSSSVPPPVLSSFSAQLASVDNNTITVLQKIVKWSEYAAFGDVIAGSRIIPMKTPLTLELQSNKLLTKNSFTLAKDENSTSEREPPSIIKEEEENHHDRQQHQEFHQHTVRTFVDEQAALGRKIGMIVDLSNHDCLYYEDLKRDCPGVAYEHFYFVAKRIPDAESCRKVAKVSRRMYAYIRIF